MMRMLRIAKPPVSPPAEHPLRFGILGAARIGPNALITPAKSHSDVVIHAVACRDKLEEINLLDDPEIDAVYIPLPNGLHFEWTMRAIDAGKHVLVEKPIADTPSEVRQIFARAEAKGVVVLEAVHFTFHPATQRVKEIVASGELGKVKSVTAEFAVPSIMSPLFFLKDDIRFKYELGGGCTMDMGVYPITAIQYLTGTDTTVPEVTDAKGTPHPSDPSRVDRAMHATYVLPSSDGSDQPTGEMFVDFGMPGWGPLGIFPRFPKLSLVVKLEGGDVEFFNFFTPHAFHTIKVLPRKGKARTEKVYKGKDGYGETWWTTYRYQLEAFVDKVRGRTPQYWPAPETSISKLEFIKRVYEKESSTYIPLFSFG